MKKQQIELKMMIKIEIQQKQNEVKQKQNNIKMMKLIKVKKNEVKQK